MFAIARTACFSILLMSLAVNNANALMYLDPTDKSVWFKRILNDSIPFRTGERIVMERTGVISPWVVAIVHLSYEDVRE